MNSKSRLHNLGAVIFFGVVCISLPMQFATMTRGVRLAPTLAVAAVVATLQALALMVFYRPLVGKPLSGSRLAGFAGALAFFFVFAFIAKGIDFGVYWLQAALGQGGPLAHSATTH